MGLHVDHDLFGASMGCEECWHETFDYLDGGYPYYNLKSPRIFSLDIVDIFQQRRERNDYVEFDWVAFACKACPPSLLGDRSLIRNVNRIP